uniref:Uncharacterized protein n=1 Tax=Oryzias latipes TaxID=8090 RepID=A0A3P9LXN1_ORYLA
MIGCSKCILGMRDALREIMLINANWEEYLTPAPLSIAIMGELLVFISSESFGACLMQVCNSGWQAFNMAHKNMDQIRIHTASVPDYMKDAVKILFQGNDEMIEKLLPNKLKSIGPIADKCVKLADGVKKKYNVICLIQELLEACVNAKHISKDDLEEIRIVNIIWKAMPTWVAGYRKFQSAINSIPALLPNALGNAGQQSASQRAAENASFCIEQSREQLKPSEEENDKANECMERNQRELTEILEDMQISNIKEIDFKTAIKMLVTGMDAMGRVKEQWEKMVRFFQMVADFANKTSLEKTMKTFGLTAEDVQRLSHNSKLFTKNLLYNQAFQASNITSLVHMISGTYCEVSNKYLMDGVSSLGKLMSMDKDKPEFLQERKKVQYFCLEAENNILELVPKNKKEFKEIVQALMNISDLSRFF